MPIKKKITSTEVDVLANISNKAIEKKPVKKVATKATKKGASPKTAAKTKKEVISKTVKAEKVEKIEDIDKKELNCIANAMLDKKANFVCSLDLIPTGTGICDYFVICNADSTAQVTAIADNVEEQMQKECKRKVIRMQGKENAFWVIIDYGNIVVHIFQTEYRQFYRLEDLWADAKKTTYQD